MKGLSVVSLISTSILLVACASQQKPAPVAAKPTPSELSEQRIIQINKEIVLEKSATEKLMCVEKNG